MNLLPSEITAGRENRRSRPKGYAAWRPQQKTKVLLDQVFAVLDEYDDHLPLTVRQIFYRLVGQYDYDKTEQAYDRLAEHLVRARRARLVPFDVIRDDGIVSYSTDVNDDYALLLVERIASAVEILDGMFRPTAADITRENYLHSLDRELAVECALEDVDERQKHLRRLLGIPDARLPSRERIRQLVEEMGAA